MGEVLLAVILVAACIYVLFIRRDQFDAYADRAQEQEGGEL